MTFMDFPEKTGFFHPGQLSWEQARIHMQVGEQQNQLSKLGCPYSKQIT